MLRELKNIVRNREALFPISFDETVLRNKKINDIRRAKKMAKKELRKKRFDILNNTLISKYPGRTHASTARPI